MKKGFFSFMGTVSALRVVHCIDEKKEIINISMIRFYIV